MKSVLKRAHAGLAAVLALLPLLLVACGGSSGGDAPPAEEGRSQALAVSRPGELTSYVQARLRDREAVLAATPGARFGNAPPTDSAGAPAASAAGTPRSGTLVQEAGVDEPDLLQSDGQTLYTLQTQPDAATLVAYGRNAEGRALPLKTLALPQDDATWANAQGMVLSADQRSLAVLQRRWERLADVDICGGPCPVSDPTGLPFAPVWSRSTVAVQRVDVSNPAAASLGASVVIEGNLLDSRRIGDALYVVSSHVPRLPVDNLAQGASAAERAAAIAATTAADVLPTMRRNGGVAQPLLQDTDCWVQPANGSLAVEVTTITVFDLRSSTLAHTSRCFVGGSEALYMTTDSLYLATTRWSYPTGDGAHIAMVYPGEMRTDIHKFSLAAGGVTYRATGQVSGHLGWNPEQKSYRLSAHNGDLRVLSFTGTVGWAGPVSTGGQTDVPPSPATLTVLRERASDQTLQALSTLPNSRRPEALGKPGEQVHGVRFTGQRGYLVTFRVVDPLYVLDLSDPADPKVAGSLEVPGFSDYLFPLDGDLLLGVGKDINAQGRVGGVKVALFDVSDPAAPRQQASVTLGGSGSMSGLDVSRHGMNMLAQGSLARVALPVALAPESGVGPWTYGLQRFEVDSSARTLKSLSMLGATSDLAATPLWDERSLQIGAQVYHLRGGTLSSYDW